MLWVLVTIESVDNTILLHSGNTREPKILFELTRSKGATLNLTHEIESLAAHGYPDDIVDVVRSNIRNLKLDIKGLNKVRF
jgi:hypothetical protein